MKNTIIFIIAITFAGASGFYLQQYLAEYNAIPEPTTQHQSAQSTVVGQPAQEFAIKDLNGNLRNINEWRGKVVLLNFWATWCPPCLHEIPGFIALQDKYSNADFQIVGVAVDNYEAVKAFADEQGMNYPVLPAETEAIELARRYGNAMGALPYSVFINKAGEVSRTFVGELSTFEVEKILESLNIRP